MSPVNQYQCEMSFVIDPMYNNRPEEFFQAATGIITHILFLSAEPLDNLSREFLIFPSGSPF